MSISVNVKYLDEEHEQFKFIFILTTFLLLILSDENSSHKIFFTQNFRRTNFSFDKIFVAEQKFRKFCPIFARLLY